MVVHFHHKHSKQSAQWKENGPNLILCADHNSLVVMHPDAFAPPEFEHDSALKVREHEVSAAARARIHDMWVDVHCPDLFDMREKGDSQPTGFTEGFPTEGTKLDLQRMHRIDCVHTTVTLVALGHGGIPAVYG